METIVNQEEIRNDQQDVQEISPKALKNGVKRIIHHIKSLETKMKAYRCCNLRRKKMVESINVTFDEDCVTKDDDEIVPSSKSEGSEGESVKDEEDAVEQDQSNKETTVNQEEIRNDQQDVQENFPKALKEWCQKNHR